jgi:hypothetical protein
MSKYFLKACGTNGDYMYLDRHQSTQEYLEKNQGCIVVNLTGLDSTSVDALVQSDRGTHREINCSNLNSIDFTEIFGDEGPKSITVEVLYDTILMPQNVARITQSPQSYRGSAMGLAGFLNALHSQYPRKAIIICANSLGVNNLVNGSPTFTPGTIGSIKMIQLTNAYAPLGDPKSCISQGIEAIMPGLKSWFIKKLAPRYIAIHKEVLTLSLGSILEIDAFKRIPILMCANTNDKIVAFGENTERLYNRLHTEGMNVKLLTSSIDTNGSWNHTTSIVNQPLTEYTRGNDEILAAVRNALNDNAVKIANAYYTYKILGYQTLLNCVLEKYPINTNATDEVLNCVSNYLKQLDKVDGDTIVENNNDILQLIQAFKKVWINPQSKSLVDKYIRKNINDIMQTVLTNFTLENAEIINQINSGNWSGNQKTYFNSQIDAIIENVKNLDGNKKKPIDSNLRDNQKNACIRYVYDIISRGEKMDFYNLVSFKLLYSLYDINEAVSIQGFYDKLVQIYNKPFDTKLVQSIDAQFKGTPNNNGNIEDKAFCRDSRYTDICEDKPFARLSTMISCASYFAQLCKQKKAEAPMPRIDISKTTTPQSSTWSWINCCNGNAVTTDNETNVGNSYNSQKTTRLQFS